MTTTKAKGIKAIVGKTIMIKSRYEQQAEGPYIFLGIDSGFFGVHNTEKGKDFWFNCNVVESFREVKSQ